MTKRILLLIVALVALSLALPQLMRDQSELPVAEITPVNTVQPSAELRASLVTLTTFEGAPLTPRAEEAIAEGALARHVRVDPSGWRALQINDPVRFPLLEGDYHGRVTQLVSHVNGDVSLRLESPMGGTAIVTIGAQSLFIQTESVEITTQDGAGVMISAALLGARDPFAADALVVPRSALPPIQIPTVIESAKSANNPALQP